MSNFEINGLSEFERELIQTINKKYPKEAKKFMRKQANEVKRQARADTPKDSGFTQKHWKTSVKGKKKASANFVVAQVTNNGQLSHLLENGHKISNHYGTYGFQPGVHMLEKAVIRKAASFDAELNAFIDWALEELAL